MSYQDGNVGERSCSGVLHDRQDAGQPAAQEALRGLQRATELQSISGETLSHRRTLKDGTHEMRASRTMTRAEAWAMADKIRAANPSIQKPISYKGRPLTEWGDKP